MSDDAKAKEPEPSPDRIVLDTNMLMRLLIVEFATKANFFASVAKVGAKIVFAPQQEDEVWRNLPKVFDEHREAWKDLLSKAKSGPPSVNTALRGLEALGVEIKPASEAARALQASSDKLKLPDLSWEAFSEFAEQVLAQIAPVETSNEIEGDLANVLVAAERRAGLRNPPTNPKKDHHLVDCLLWESVLRLLRQGHRVWFASTDGDFLYDGCLHPFLDREARRAGGSLRFFAESRERGFNPGVKFAVLQAIVSAEVAAKFLPAADLVSPPAVTAEEDDYDDYEDPRGSDPSKCFCGNPALIDSLTCRRCGLDSFDVSGDENYALRKTKTGYRITSTYDGPRGEQESDPVACERCKATVFDVSFESRCGYCKHMASRDD